MEREVNVRNTTTYRFGGFHLLPAEKQLLNADKPIPLPPRVFDLLVVLVENAGTLVTKEELLDTVWSDSFVEEATLAQAVSRLRKALGQTADEEYVETVAKSGYRFVAPVTEIDAATDEVSDQGSDDSPVAKGEKQRPAWQHMVPVFAVIGVLALAILALSFIWSGNDKPDNDVTSIESIAVLPFKSLGKNEEDRALELGMADALITKLSGLEAVGIRPTSAVARYTGTETVDPINAGRELNVDAVLDGRIQKDGERVRVTIQLFETKGGTSIWADKFDSRSTDLFSLQDQISTRVAETLSLKLTGREKELIAKRSTDNPEAYAAYIRGRYLWRKRGPDDLKRSLTFFEKAIKIDPDYASAHSGLADCYQLFAEYRIMPTAEAFAKARNAARKALGLDESLAEAHTSLAYILAFYDWNWEEAEKSFKRAIELKPNYATAHQWYAEYLIVVGRFDEAKSAIFKAEELDPLSPVIGTDIATLYHTTKQPAKTVEKADAILESDPDFAWAHGFRYLGYYKLGEKDKAIEAVLNWGLHNEIKSEEEVRELQKIYRDSGWNAFWRRYISQMKEKPGIFLAWDYALCYIYLEDYETAIDWLEKSFEKRERFIVGIKYDPLTDPLRSNPRFQKLVAKLGLE